jgi:hypothetical protein
MTITKTYESYKFLDGLLSDETWLPQNLPGRYLYDLWQAIKTQQQPCVWTETGDEWR